MQRSIIKILFIQNEILCCDEENTREYGRWGPSKKANQLPNETATNSRRISEHEKCLNLGLLATNCLFTFHFHSKNVER